MKTPRLRPLLHTLALAAAFVSGWAFHSTPPAAEASAASTLHRGLERDYARIREKGTTNALPAPARAAEENVSGNPLPVLRSLSLPGAAATPLEKLQMLAQYGAEDPETALTFVDTLPAGERADAAATVMSAWAARDPQAAAAHLEAEAGGLGLSDKEATAAASAVALEWSRRDPNAAVQWAAGLPDELRAGALNAAMGVQSATDPVKAQQLLAAIDDPSIRAETAAPLASQWATSDPAGAASWASSLSSAGERSAALAGVTSAWMMKDPASASQWVNNLPAGPGKDAAIVALTNSPVIRNDAESAAVWAAAIQDPGLRGSTLARSLQRWRYQQPQAFAADQER